MSFPSVHLRQIDSTNRYCKREADRLGDFVFVHADTQTSGKGRNKRKWVDEEGKNLLFSLFSRDPRILALNAKASLCVAAIVAKVLQGRGIKDVTIKWPNDIYAGGKKIAGILAESRAGEYLIVGVGLNVNQTSFEGEYRREPTSVALEKGEVIDLDSLREEIFSALGESLFRDDIVSFSLAFIRQNDFLLGKRIRAEISGDGVFGIGDGLDDDFELNLKTNEGRRTVVSGEIMLLGDHLPTARIAYPAYIYQDEEDPGWWNVSFPDVIPGVTCGDSPDNALFMAKDLLALMIREAPVQVFPPSSLEQVKKERDLPVIMVEIDVECEGFLCLKYVLLPHAGGQILLNEAFVPLSVAKHDPFHPYRCCALPFLKEKLNTTLWGNELIVDRLDCSIEELDATPRLLIQDPYDEDTDIACFACILV